MDKQEFEDKLIACLEQAGEAIAEDQIAQAELRRTWQDRMFAKYPEIFQDRTKPMTVTCMCWGLSCGYGWEKLIDSLCSQLTLIRKASGIKMVASQVKEKYGTLRFYLGNEDGFPGQLPEDATPRQELVHMIRLWCYYKEYSVRRWWFYFTRKFTPAYIVNRRKAANNTWNDIIDACVSAAERKSAYTCEVCGAHGQLNRPGPGGWVMTRCAKHWEGPGTYDKPGEYTDEDEAEEIKDEMVKTDNSAV